MKTRSALVLASVLVAVGCGGNNPDDASGGSDVVPCVGDACWDCKPIQIKSGAQVVCENDATTNDGTPRSWECPSVDHLCPPIDALTSITAIGTTDGVLGDGETGGSDQNPGSSDGVSALDGGAGGAHDAGTILEAGSVSGGGSAADAGCDSGSGGSTTADAGGGGSDAGGGGGFHCTSDGTKTVCEGTPTCAPGTHLSSCGQCVSDSCTSCSCSGGTDGGTVADSGSASDSGGSLGCTLTQGYWKTHAKAWPVQSLVLGGKSYTQAELLAILNTPANGDASIILAYQLIAAKLNLLSGSSSSPIGSVIAQADAWLAAHADADGRLPFGVASASAAGQVAVALGAELDRYNNGLGGVPHCK